METPGTEEVCSESIKGMSAKDNGKIVPLNEDVWKSRETASSIAQDDTRRK